MTGYQYGASRPELRPRVRTVQAYSMNGHPVEVDALISPRTEKVVGYINVTDPDGPLVGIEQAVEKQPRKRKYHGRRPRRTTAAASS